MYNNKRTGNLKRTTGERSPLTNISISLAEDDQILCDLVKLRLTRMGYRVNAGYSSGEDLIKSIAKGSPDLILMDITLSGKMDGITAAQYAQKRYNIPVVFLTASTDSETFERAKITDDCEYVVKPFSDQDLRIAIELAYHKFELHRKLKRKQKFLEKLILNIGEALIVTDSEGFITMMNPAAEALIDHEYQSARKFHLRELLSIVDDAGRVMENPVDRITDDPDVMDLPDNAFLVPATGGKIPVKGCVSPIRDDKGKVTGVIVSVSAVSRPKVLRYSGKRKY
jgi:PAS domain S-box-containing protein